MIYTYYYTVIVQIIIPTNDWYFISNERKMRYNLLNNMFTSGPQNNSCKQFRIAQSIFLKIMEKGFTSTSTLAQLHCSNCNK